MLAAAANNNNNKFAVSVLTLTTTLTNLVGAWSRLLLALMSVWAHPPTFAVPIHGSWLMVRGAGMRGGGRHEKGNSRRVGLGRSNINNNKVLRWITLTTIRSG